MAEPSYLGITRSRYDEVAGLYSEQFAHELDKLPLDRALLAAFAELVRTPGTTTVADLGCGPGHVTAYLYSLGLTAFGIDLSPAMVALGRRLYPHLRFDVGSMTELDLPANGLGGVLSWYSIIHTPPDSLPGVFAEFYRVLAPGGYALLAFFSGDKSLRSVQEFDHKVTPGYRWPINQLAQLSRQAGFSVLAELLREPNADERFPRGHLVVRKPPTLS